METPEPTGHRRHIRVHTTLGIVEGHFITSPMLRLLDDLNVERTFLTVEDLEVVSGRWPTGGGPVAVNRDAILFVAELSPPPERPIGAVPANLGRYTPALVLLSIGDYRVEGAVHVPQGGNAIVRLQHPAHAYVALTGVTIRGPEGQVEVPFVAVNRNRVLAAQELEPSEE